MKEIPRLQTPLAETSLQSLPVTVFRLLVWKRGRITRTHPACEHFLICHTFQHFPYTWLPSSCTRCAETDMVVFPQSCDYSEGERVALSEYSYVTSLCLCVSSVCEIPLRCCDCVCGKKCESFWCFLFLVCQIWHLSVVVFIFLMASLHCLQTHVCELVSLAGFADESAQALVLYETCGIRDLTWLEKALWGSRTGWLMVVWIIGTGGLMGHKALW